MFHQAYRRGMSYKHVGTAADLVRYGCSLKIECTACGYACTMPAIEVARLHGSGSLEHFRARLKCKRCRMKVAKVTALPPL